MTTFTVTGEIDPFLHVSITQGDMIYCESGAMVMMEDNLELKGKMRGGLGRALMRRFANGESFFSSTSKRLREMVIVSYRLIYRVASKSLRWEPSSIC